ncbi:MAG: hypothetical protein ACRDKW_08320 [Actinomycetota bacterium]
MARVYAGGVEITVEDGVPMIGPIPGPERDPTAVTRAGRAWMLDAIGILDTLSPGWTTIEEHRAPHRRWPWLLVLASPDESVAVTVGSDYVNLNGHVLDDLDRAWRLWWRIVKAFVRNGCVAFEPDESEIVRIAVSLPSATARERYFWF